MIKRRHLLPLLCLLATNLTTSVRADQAADLLQRVATTVAARRPILVESTLTIEYKNGKAFAKITCHQKENAGNASTGAGLSQPDGTPPFWEVVPMEDINPLVPNPTQFAQPGGANNAAGAEAPAPRALGKEKIDGEEYDVVEITTAPSPNNRILVPFRKVDLQKIVRKLYIGQDGLVHRIRGASIWAHVDNLPGNVGAVKNGADKKLVDPNKGGQTKIDPQPLETTPFELVVTGYRKPITFTPRPDSQPPIKTIAFDPNVGFSRIFAFSPNGKIVAYGTQEGDIHIVNAETGKEQNVLKGHLSQVMSVAFSPDCKRLVSADSLVVAVWDVDAGNLLYTMKDQPNTSALLVMPDGKSVLVGGNNGKAQIRSLEKGQTLRTLDQKLSPPLTLSPDGAYLANSNFGTLQLLNTGTWQTIPIEIENSPFQCSPAFSPDGTRLATAGLDGVVHLLDGRTGRKVKDLTGALGRISAVWFSADGARITALDIDGRGDFPTNTPGLTTWDIASGQVTQSLSLGSSAIVQPGFGPFGGNTFVVGDKLAQMDPSSQRLNLWALPLLPAAH